MPSISVTSQRDSDSLYASGVMGLKALSTGQEEHCKSSRTNSSARSSAIRGSCYHALVRAGEIVIVIVITANRGDSANTDHQCSLKAVAYWLERERDRVMQRGPMLRGVIGRAPCWPKNLCSLKILTPSSLTALSFNGQNIAMLQYIGCCTFFVEYSVHTNSSRP